MSQEKRRLDFLLLERGLASTRTKAQELIRAGHVVVDGAITKKTGEKVSPDSKIELTAKEHPYVSRGGLKLSAALDHFGIDLKGKRVLDIGQSTGGFTHAVLLRGAKEVVGVEVGEGQLAEELKADPRVRSFEKQDVRALDPHIAGAPFEFFVVDLSFISLSLVVPHFPKFLQTSSEGILLVKPQFEVGKEGIGSGGIVRDAALREWATEKVVRVCQENGFTVTGAIESPILGGDGNRESLIHVRWISS